MSTAIKVENLSKIYRLGEIGTGTLSLDFQRWLAKIRGKDDPYLTIGEDNDRSQKGGKVVYSLRDINFEIQQGEAVGIIGRNGAGKSTLLKVLSRITSPTAGKISLKGRVASLLEVGTGFHPELTGKENIFLNGAIMGMTKKEISALLDEIIDFSGVERYIDTPVKRYSSGMYVRLAFAVAAHLESEILIVDEVLAVGDVEFQKKCLGKMGDMSKSEGRTVLFVSHNLSSISTLCTKGILLSQGRVVRQGNVDEVINSYKSLIDRDNTDSYVKVGLNSQHVLMSANLQLNGQQPNKNLDVHIKLNVSNELKSALLVIDIINSDGVCIFQSVAPLNELPARAYETEIIASIKISGIVPDLYLANVYMCDTFFQNIDAIIDRLYFEILESPVKEKLNFIFKGTENGYIYPETTITLKS